MAFVATADGGVYAIDVTDSFDMQIVADFQASGYVSSVAVAGDRLYVTDPFGGLWLLRFEK